MSFSGKLFYEFGSFRLQADNRVLMCGGEVVKLMPKTGEALLILIQQQGQVVGKEELLKALWPDVVVEENNLSQHISALRKALGQDNNGNRFIETVPKRGYRFVAEVREVIADKALVPAPAAPKPEPAAEHEQTQNLAMIEAKGEQGHPRSRPVRRRRLLVNVGLLLVIGLALAFAVRPALKPAPRAGIEQIKSVAVLPFKSLHAEAGDEDRRLGIGIADNLINRLGRSSQLIVRPVRAVSSFAGTAHDPLVAGRELSVDAVLDGSVQRAGERLRVTAQLLRVSDGGTLWADRFDGQGTDILAAQDWIAERLAAPLASRLGAGQPTLSAHTPTDEARRSYMRGRYLWNRRTPEAINKAIAHFRLAVEQDPRYAVAWAGLAEAYMLQPDLDAQEKARRVKEAAGRALELDESLAEAHTALAFLYENLEYDWEQAERSYRRAITLNPNYATAHHWYAECLAFMGRFDEALAEINRALEIDPASLAINKDLALIHGYAGRGQQAIELFRRTLELDPNFTPAVTLMATTCEAEGRYVEAVEHYLRAYQLSGIAAAQIAALRAAYARSGWRGFWRQELEFCQRGRHPGPYVLAQIHLRLGDREKAIQLLQQAFAARHLMTALKVDALFRPLHNDPRFTDLLRRVGLAG